MSIGQTRAAFEDKVSVTLNNELSNISDVRSVNHWNLGDYQTVISKEAFERKEEGFVTITDSVLVYTVKFDEFSFDYRLNYEVAVYDDGITRQIMPYYYYSNIKDNGGTLEMADSYVDGDFAYARRIYHHSLSVDFAGKTYQIQADITLRRKIGNADERYIVRSEVLDKKIVYSPEDQGFVSSIKIKSLMSDNEVREDLYSSFLPAYSERYTGDEITFYGKLSDIKLQDISIETVSHSFDEENNYIIKERITENCILKYNNFNLTIPLVHYEALFDNVVLQEDMFSCYYDEQKVRVKSENWSFIETDGNKQHYFLTLVIEVNIGDMTLEGVYEGWFVLIE